MRVYAPPRRNRHRTTSLRLHSQRYRHRSFGCTPPTPRTPLSDSDHSLSPSPSGACYNSYKYDTETIYPPLPDLIEWFKIKQLLEQLNDEQTISNNAFQLIIETVSLNIKHFITYLYEHNHLNQQQLNSMYHILKNDILDNASNVYFSNYKSKTTHSAFDVLSIPSITNICSYLNKNDILSFKNTSINIALIAFNEMQKYHIGVFNMNELLFHNEYNNFALFKQTKTNDIIKNERYAPSIKFNKIIQVWSRKYNMDPVHMTIVYDETHNELRNLRRFGMGSSEYFIKSFLNKNTEKCHVISNNIDISDFTVNHLSKKHTFLVFDKRKMSVLYDIESDSKYNDNDTQVDTQVIYDVTKQWSCGKCTFINPLSKNTCDMCNSAHDHESSLPCMDIMSKYNHQSMILLHYFDLKQQKITFCRSLVVHRNYGTKELKEYIEKNVHILISDYDMELHPLVMEMKRYNAKHDIKETIISLYKYSINEAYTYNLRHNDRDILCNDNDKQKCFQVFVFELNPSHHLMSIADDNYISKLRNYYDRMLNESFWANPIALMQDIYKRLKWKNNELIPDFGARNVTLSPLLMTHICSYLNNTDIKVFKMVSSGAAMLSIKEMRKINIASFYIHNMKSSNIYNNFSKFKNIDAKTLINYTRFHRDSVVKDLCTFWCQQYNIPHNDLLIVLAPADKSEVGLKALQLLSNEDAEIMDNTKMLMKARCIRDEGVFLIFDKRKLRRVQTSTHNHNNIYKILLLYYFDFMHKTISYWRPLAIPNDSMCTMHIIESFIADNAFELVSCSSCETLCKMKKINKKQNIFKFYQTNFDHNNELQIKYRRIKMRSALVENVIFQLNDEHDMFEQSNRAHHPQLLFCKAQSVAIRYMSNGISLREVLAYFGSVVLFYPKDYAFKLNIHHNAKAEHICKHISKRFQSMIPYHQIQLFINGKKIKCNESLIDVGLFEWSKSAEQSWIVTPKICVNTYTNIAYADKFYIMYNISVYPPNDTHLLHLGDEYETALPDTEYTFYVPFDRKFIVKDLIVYLESMCKGIFREKYKTLLKYFYKGDTDEEKYSFLISSCSGRSKELMENCYEGDSLVKYNVNIGNKLSIFIVNNNKYMNNDLLEQSPVIVRFKKKRSDGRDLKEYYKNIGRPERIWINKSTLLSKINWETQTPPSLVLYNNGHLSLINVETYCFYNQISPPVSTKKLLKNDVNLHQAIFRKQRNFNCKDSNNISHVLLVTVS